MGDRGEPGEPAVRSTATARQLDSDPVISQFLATDTRATHPSGCLCRVVEPRSLTSVSRGSIAPRMVAVEEQPRKPLCLDSDLGNG